MTANAKESDADTFLGRVMRCNSVRVGFFLAIGALLVRGGICWQSLEKYQDDPDAYRSIAETLGTKGVLGLTAENGQAIATAFRPPLYPTLLSWFVQDQQLLSTAVACLHILMGVATVLFTYCVPCPCSHATPVFGPRSCAILVMVDPLLLQQSRLVMTETLAAMLVSVTLWWWACCRHKMHGALRNDVGHADESCVFARPTFVVWAFYSCLRSWLLIYVLSRQNPAGIEKAFVVRIAVQSCCGCCSCGRDWSVGVAEPAAVGDPVWATTHGGYTLLLGNNPYFYDFLQNGSADGRWDSEAFQIAYSHRYDGDPNPGFLAARLGRAKARSGSGCRGSGERAFRRSPCVQCSKRSYLPSAKDVPVVVRCPGFATLGSISESPARTQRVGRDFDWKLQLLSLHWHADWLHPIGTQFLQREVVAGVDPVRDVDFGSCGLLE